LIEYIYFGLCVWVFGLVRVCLHPPRTHRLRQFFNVCFCTAFGIAKVDKYLVVEQSLLSFLGYFFAWCVAFKG
jgi:hypothetical protein